MIEAIELFLTGLFAAITLLAGVAFVVFRHPVYAALSFTAAVLAATGLYVLQNAAYVAAATIVIYAGATIIIFLFVLMFAQHSHLQTYELKYSNLGVAVVASLCLVLLLSYAVTTRDRIAIASSQPQARVANSVTDSAALGSQSTSATQSASPTADDGGGPQSAGERRDNSVAALGRVLYTRYLWSIELAGTLLLIAAGGAITIAHREPNAIQSTGAPLS